MILNENQKEMYKNCMFLNEGLFSKPIMKITPRELERIFDIVEDEFLKIIKEKSIRGYQTGRLLNNFKQTGEYKALWLGTFDNDSILNFKPEINKRLSKKNLETKLGHLSKYYKSLYFYYNGNYTRILILMERYKVD